MTDRRQFLKASPPGASALATGKCLDAAGTARQAASVRVASTRDFGSAANEAAWATLGQGGYPDRDAKDQRALIPAKSVFHA
ncbi:hypothetical protein [Rhodanobacter geophilus]|uniref:Twin-arginine translocation signal domain-containing protein n=1 Tax=Rhodanobacter geophilus TaxID=3162488 RepID=A0ABV3QKW7_9GAMM